MKVQKSLLLFIILFSTSFCVFAQSDSTKVETPMIDYEQMPQFPEGDEALIKTIRKNLHYPLPAIVSGIEGRVTVRFIIGIDGTISDVKVIRGLSKECDEEAVRVTRLLSKWIPGSMSGVPVPVYYTLPIVFKIQYGLMDENAPLFLVNGKAKSYNMFNGSNLLKLSQIKSIRVLKDSAAVSEYGSRAIHGAIIVETKRR